MNKEAKYWIKKLDLSKHPEGGYYRETYRCNMKILYKNRYRSISSGIYFLLDGSEFSAFHRLRSDEMWHFYAGGSLTLHVISRHRRYSLIKLGNDLEDGDVFHTVIRYGSWFGATVDDRLSYSLLGCTVSPGFDFQDFELGQRKKLIEMYPEYRSIIEKLTRN